jgi:Spirocyclase AveC-like
MVSCRRCIYRIECRLVLTFELVRGDKAALRGLQDVAGPYLVQPTGPLRGPIVATSLTPATKTTLPTEATLPSDSRMRPVLWWAAFGIFFGCVAIYSVISWMTSPDFTPTPTGVTPIPSFIIWGNNIQQVGEAIGVILVLYYVVIRPWWRAGHITLDGTIVLAGAGVYWWDPIPNYFGPQVSYNSALLNRGSWSSHVPGWVSANGSRMPEPPLYAGLWYPIGFILIAILISFVMRTAKQRWPKMGNSSLILIALAVGMVLDLILEVIYVRLGTYVYPGAYKPLTIFYGHYYQFPLLCAVFSGLSFGIIGALRYFTNDKGQTFVEGGIAELRVLPWQRHVVRFLAIYGLFNVCCVLACSQYWWTSAHEQPWPKDILERSYFMNGICGAGTDVACPGGVIPITQRDTVHLNPENTLVVPPGASLPEPVPFKTK